MGLARLTEIDGSPGLEVVVGLNWDTISKGDWRRQKKTAKTDGIVYCEIPVTAGDTNTVNTGIIDRDCINEKELPFSLAAWMAHSFKNETVVAVERLVTPRDEESLWLCIIHNGQVISGTDILAAWEDIDSQVSEIIEMLALTGDIGFIGSEAENLTANTGSDQDATQLATILSKQAKKKAVVQVPGTVNKTLVLAGVATGIGCALAIGGYTAINMLSETDNTEQLRKARMEQIAKAKQDYADLIAGIESSPGASDTISLLLSPEHLGAMQTQMGGWGMQEVSCDQQKCEVEFSNADLTDPAILEQSAGDHCEELSVTLAGLEGQCHFDMPTADADLGQAYASNNVRTMRSAFMEYVRAYDGASYAIEPAEEMSVSGKRHLRDKAIPKEGKWALVGPLSQAPQMTELLNQMPGLTLSNVDINWQGKALELSGQYYTKGDSQ